METQRLSRIRLATVVAVASLGAIWAILAVAQATGGPAALRPDLVTLAIQQPDLAMTTENGERYLRLTNEVGNHGNGPLEVFPSPASPNCDGDGDPENDREASQRLFADGNATGMFERGVDPVDSERSFGCMRYHAAHDHWHVLDFALYQLRRERSGKVAVSSRKVGFCLVDNTYAFDGPGSAVVPHYPVGAKNPNGGCDANATQGLSPGWADIYALALPGQQLAVGGLPRGRYCLISRADPFNLLTELDEANNVRRTRIAMRPNKLRVRKLRGPCKG